MLFLAKLQSPYSFLRATSKSLILLITTFPLLLFCLVAVEIFFLVKQGDLWVCEICVFDSALGWVHAPSKMINKNGISYSTNSFGFRGLEPDLTKNHILILGDSVGFGLGVNDDETLDAHLNRGVQHFQVLNLSVSGYGIGQYYLRLKKHIHQTNPSHVWTVIYTGNDLDDTRKDTTFGVCKPFVFLKNGQLKNLNFPIAKFSCANWALRSRIFVHLIPKPFLKILCSSKTIERKSAAGQIESILKGIANLAWEHGANFLFILSPTMDSIILEACREGKTLKGCDQVDKGFLTYYSYFRGLMEHNKFNYLDYQKNLVQKWGESDIKQLYGDSGRDIHHYSSLGNRLLAETLKEYLITLGQES